jgi:hypothetical protein
MSLQVGNISDLKAFKINELAGVKLDREISVVAFQDGRQVPLPPGTGYVDENGKVGTMRITMGRMDRMDGEDKWKGGHNKDT